MSTTSIRLSSPQNPAFEVPPPNPGGPAAAIDPLPPSRWTENPAWTGWDVLGILGVFLGSLFFFSMAVVGAAKWIFYPSQDMNTVIKSQPLLALGAQGLAYLVAVVFMVVLVKYARQKSFWQAVLWNWPRDLWPYILGGIALAIAMVFTLRFLPNPETEPFDPFFKTQLTAWILLFFGVIVAPFMEELFFRGFLYPVLVRRLGFRVSIFLTGISFGLIHGWQYAYAWAPILLVSIVGIVLTIVRATSKSLAASTVMHMSYNATIFAGVFAYTDAFRHLEKLAR